MNVLSVVLAALAVLFGSFPSGVVLTRLVTGRDVRDVGSGNIGAANASRAGGPKLGVAVALFDALKGVIPVAIGLIAKLPHPALAVIALAAVLGHDFSLFLRFRGGKGVATTLGVMAILVPVETALAGIIWVVLLASTRISSLASLVALVVIPFAAGWYGAPPPYVALAVLLCLLSAAKHWENILRLLQGKEARIGSVKPAQSE